MFFKFLLRVFLIFFYLFKKRTFNHDFSSSHEITIRVFNLDDFANFSDFSMIIYHYLTRKKCKTVNV